MLDGKKISLAQFETFLVVAELQSFTSAAKALKLTKAAVSLAVKALEEELKVNLFIRTTRSILLTPEGEIILSQCQKLKDELDITRSLILGLHDKPKGKLKVSCNTELAEKHLLPIIQQYLEKFPQIKIEIIIEERMPDMQQEQIDLVYGINWPAPDSIVARKIGETRYIMCASPGYVKKHGAPNDLQELSGHLYIPHSGRSKENYVASIKNKPSALTTNSNFTANNIQFIRTCVLNGLGIAQFHDYIVNDDIDSGNLVEILPNQFKDKENLYIYYQKNRFVQPKVRQLVNLILNENL